MKQLITLVVVLSLLAPVCLAKEVSVSVSEEMMRLSEYNANLSVDEMSKTMAEMNRTIKELKDDVAMIRNIYLTLGVVAIITAYLVVVAK